MTNIDLSPYVMQVARVCQMHSGPKTVRFQEWVGDIDLAIRLDRRPEVAERWPEALLEKADIAANAPPFSWIP